MPRDIRQMDAFGLVRQVTPNNSFKPSPLRGLGAIRFASGGPA